MPTNIKVSGTLVELWYVVGGLIFLIVIGCALVIYYDHKAHLANRIVPEIEKEKSVMKTLKSVAL